MTAVSENLAGAHSLRACSNCAGDYEDPDRTAWPENEDSEPEDDETRDDRSKAESTAKAGEEARR